MEEQSTTTATPSAPAPASTPAASTPAPSVATTSAPVSAREALALADSSPATPASSTQAVSTPAAAIAQPADGTTTPTVSANATPPAPPAWRWQEILANARTKAAEDATAKARAEIEAQYSGLSDFASIDANERAGLLVLRRALSGDQAARAQLAQAAQRDPSIAQALSGMFATETAQARGAEAMPEPDLQAQDGTLVYSAQQMQKLREWDQRQLTSSLTKSFDEKLQPLSRVAETFQQREQQAQAWTEVGQILTQFRADPDFKAHEKEVKAELAQDPRLAALADRDPQQALELAFNRVYRELIVPARAKASEGDTLANLQRKAVAGTTNPATATPTMPAKTLGNARAALEAVPGEW